MEEAHGKVLKGKKGEGESMQLYFNLKIILKKQKTK